MATATNDRMSKSPPAVRGKGDAAGVLKARPVKNPPSFKAMRAEDMKRFSKTLAYLAK